MTNLFNRLSKLFCLTILLLFAGVFSGPVFAFFYIVSVSPEVNETGVSLEKVIKIKFNKAVDRASIDGNFYIMGPTGKVGGTWEFDYSSNSLAFIPDKSQGFQYETQYVAVVREFLESTDAEPLGEEKNWSFTTEPPLGEIQNFYAYPNPCTETIIRLHYTLTRDADSAHVELFNRNRQLVRTEDLPIFSGNNVTNFELVDAMNDELANGLYYLRLKVHSLDGGEVSSVSRFVKLR